MKPQPDGCLKKLQAIFRENDYREAHQKSKEVLLEMAKNPDVLFGIIRQNLSSPGFFSKKRINPVIAFEVDDNKDFSIIAHCWMPLPDRDTNITHQSIHHHGRLLLTSVSPIGEGYESVVFKKNFELDKKAGLAKMDIEKVYQSPQHNIEFIDANTPHVVFYPRDFSITYAMWSYDKKDGIMALLRRSKFVKANKKIITKILRGLGLISEIGINNVEYFDFYPKDRQIQALRDRIKYPAGSNENFVHNVFYILQKVGFPDKEFICGLWNGLTENERAVVGKPMNEFLNDEPLQDVFDPSQLNIPKINFKKNELLEAVGYSAN